MYVCLTVRNNRVGTALNSGRTVRIHKKYERLKEMCSIRRIKAISLAMAVILSIGSVAGCGKKEEDKKSNTSGGSGAATNAETEYFSNVQEALDGTPVKFATWIDQNSNESSQVLADFTNLTGIKVEITYVPQMDYANKIAGLISSGQSPDVYVSNGDFPVCMQMLRPLDKTILNPSDSFWDQDIVKMGTIGAGRCLIFTHAPRRVRRLPKAAASGSISTAM